MGVVTVSEHSPWVMARWAMALLIDRASSLTDEADDRAALAQAKALDGLHCDLLDKPQRQRVAAAVRSAAEALARERQGSDDQRDQELAELLDDLALCLTETADGN